MTPDERDLLDRFLSDLVQARPGPKDAEAARRIDAAMRANPDAAYLLVQHAILADHALADAQARLAELEDAGAGRAAPGSFLGGLFDRGRPASPPGGYAPTSVPPTAGGPAPGWGAGSGGSFGMGGPGPFSGGGGLGSFLRSAGTTAAGVAGGAFLFEGLSGLFGGHERQGFGDFGGGAQGFADMGRDGFDADGGPDARPVFDEDDGQG